MKQSEYLRLIKMDLPKTINLHKMVCIGVDFSSEPSLVEYTDGTNHVVSTHNIHTYSLIDTETGMEVTVKITKDKHA